MFCAQFRQASSRLWGRLGLAGRDKSCLGMAARASRDPYMEGTKCFGLVS